MVIFYCLVQIIVGLSLMGFAFSVGQTNVDVALGMMVLAGIEIGIGSACLYNNTASKQTN